jgi:hypothetical protein
VNPPASLPKQSLARAEMAEIAPVERAEMDARLLIEQVRKLA